MNAIFVNVFLYCICQISAFNLIVLLRVGLASSDPSGTTSSNKTDLTTSAGATLDGGRFTDVLMITTTVRMLHGIHSDTTNLRKSFSNVSNTARKRRDRCERVFRIRSVKEKYLHIKFYQVSNVLVAIIGKENFNSSHRNDVKIGRRTLGQQFLFALYL